MQNLKRNDINEPTYKMDRDSQTERMNLWEFMVGEGKEGEKG